VAGPRSGVGLGRGVVALVCGTLAACLLAASALSGILASNESGGCEAPPETGGHPGFAAPLVLQRGRSYVVGATEYGGPGDPSSGVYGSIPDSGQAFLPSHPDSFAELSVLPVNPADNGAFTFADANALGRLPYLTALRVWRAGRQLVVAKRDIGYGQGLGQRIGDGEPYRLDLWWQAARALGVSKGPVRIALTPGSGAAATLEALPETAGSTSGSEFCEAGGTAVLPLVAGAMARVLPSGLAAAGAQAPATVRAMIAAGNRLHAAAYSYGAGHGPSLNVLQAAYDCSSAVSYMLHAGGLLGASAWDSTELERFGVPGPGRYVSVYANAAHAFLYVDGVRLDTVEDPAFDQGPNAGRPGPKWRVSPTVPGWAAWVVHHPAGL